MVFLRLYTIHSFKKLVILKLLSNLYGQSFSSVLTTKWLPGALLGSGHCWHSEQHKWNGHTKKWKRIFFQNSANVADPTILYTAHKQLVCLVLYRVRTLNKKIHFDSHFPDRHIKKTELINYTFLNVKVVNHEESKYFLYRK